MRSARVAVVLVAFLAAVGLVPSRVAGRDAHPLYAGELHAQSAVAQGVADAVTGDLDEGAFVTGSTLFDGEWRFGSYMMAAMGLGQLSLEHPELRARYAPVVAACVKRMVEPRISAFDDRAWSEAALASLDGENGHVAYLGYLNLAIEMDRVVDPASPWSALGERITAALARRFDASPTRLLETYPGEEYPVDNTAALASIALRDRVAGDDAHAGVVARVLEAIRGRYTDKATGLLVQAVDPSSGAVRDGARGSGTLLAVYFLSFADTRTSRALWDAATRELSEDVLGFGVMREYPRAGSGRGDVDSGPVVLGAGVSATGFALAGARIYGDEKRFRSLHATVTLFGAPVDRAGARRFATGGPLGDAILLAMTTAAPGGAS